MTRSYKTDRHSLTKRVSLTTTALLLALSTLTIPEPAHAAVTLDLKNADLEKARVVSVTDFGAIPDDGKDDSEQIHQALQESLKEPIRLKFPAGTFIVDATHNIEVVGSKGIWIDGDDRKTKFDYKNNKTGNLPEFHALQLHMAEENAGVIVEGMDFDGHRNEQDMFFTFNDKLSGYGGDTTGFYNTRLAKGVNVTKAHKADFYNNTFQNAYGGYSIQLDQYNDVDIQDIDIKNVGGDGQTDSLGMAIYLAGHDGDATVNIDDVQAEGKHGTGPQSNAGTPYKNPGDPSYYSWIGVVAGENGSIQNPDPTKWHVDKNTTFNITNSTFNKFETMFHTESMAGNVAVNVNNVKGDVKHVNVSAGLKGRYAFTGNKMDVTMPTYGRNNVYSTIAAAEFGDDKRFHDGYNANVSGGPDGGPLHTQNYYNSKFTYQDTSRTAAGAPGVEDLTNPNDPTNYFKGGMAYGNMVNANFYCSQFDGLWNYAYANAGGSVTNSVINLSEKNPQPATKEGITAMSGQPVTFKNTSVNPAGSWQNVTATCEAPTFQNFSGLAAPSLDDPLIPAPIGGVTGPVTTETPSTETPATEAPATEAPATEAPATEAPATEDPATEAPATEAPATEAPATEAPATEEPATEGPVSTEAPVTVEDPIPTVPVSTEAPPATELPSTERPTTEDVTTEASTTERPTTEASTTERPTTEKATTEDVTDEAETDEASTEKATTETVTDEPVTDEAETDEAETDEASTDEDVTTEEAATDEASTDEPVTDEASTDEDAKTEEAVTDEDVTDEDATTEEAATDDVSTDETVTDEDVTTEETATEEAVTDEDVTTDDKTSSDEPGLFTDSRSSADDVIRNEVDPHQLGIEADGSPVKDQFKGMTAKEIQAQGYSNFLEGEPAYKKRLDGSSKDKQDGIAVERLIKQADKDRSGDLSKQEILDARQSFKKPAEQPVTKVLPNTGSAAGNIALYSGVIGLVLYGLYRTARRYI